MCDKNFVSRLHTLGVPWQQIFVHWYYISFIRNIFSSHFQLFQLILQSIAPLNSGIMPPLPRGENSKDQYDSYNLSHSLIKCLKCFHFLYWQWLIVTFLLQTVIMGEGKRDWYMWTKLRRRVPLCELPNFNKLMNFVCLVHCMYYLSPTNQGKAIPKIAKK